MKLTKNRSIILEVLKSGGAYSVAKLHSLLPEMDQATIYRAINLFVSEGIVKEIRIDKEKSLFEIIHDEHQHAWCSKCQEINHINVDKKKLIKALDLKDFDVEDIEVYVRGKCK